MVDFREDTGIWPVMIAVAGRVENENDTSGFKAIEVAVRGGELVELDCDENCLGQGWVRLVTTFPSVTFPNPDQTVGCGSQLAYQLEVGISRCIAVMDHRGNPPSTAALLVDARQQIADMAAMRRAICAALKAEGRRYVLNEYRPIGAGGCGGGAWLVTVAAS